MLYMEEGSHSPETQEDSMISKERPAHHIQASKKRKVGEKRVVRVKINEENEGKQRSELGQPPSDRWSWRKYGQKPIKGSPFPRGYYKCSTSKGCLAKKQVERCRTDASMLIITYTSTHNHPSPNHPTKHPKIQSPEEEQEEEEENNEEVQPLEMITTQGTSSTSNDFHYCQSPLMRSSTQDMIIISQEDQEINPFTENHHLLLDEEPLSYPHLMTFSTTALKSELEEGNDFYDELEALPISSSSFTSFMRTNFFEERILV